MTQLSPTMTEGILVEWLKKEGDLVKPGDPLASVETDKAVMELESFEEGILLAHLAKKGDHLPVGAPVAIVGRAGDDITPLLERAKNFRPDLKKAESKPEQPREEPAPSPVPTVVEAPESVTDGVLRGRVKISPLARQMAQKYGLDITTLKGTGPGGRIIRRDIEKALQERPQQVIGAFSRKADVVKPLSMMRQVIAKRLSDSKSQVPHFYLTRKVVVSKLVQLREETNKTLQLLKDRGELLPYYPEKVSLNDYIIRACALALKIHPEVNAQWGGDKLILKGNIDIGVAVAMEDGLLTPIVRNADEKSLFAISIEVKNLAEKARKRKLQSEEYTGGSFTISNLGMYGIDYFQAIINAPEAALLAVGKTKTEPVFNGTNFIPQEILTVTLSCDHRVVDGAKGAEFLQTLSFLLENPQLL